MARHRRRYGSGSYDRFYDFFAPRVTVDARRHEAAKRAADLAKAGRETSPVRIEGRTIARTFWGQAWCQNLEAYSDFSNRLPRGRSYVRNGSVLDLAIEAGKVVALVSGSSLYDVEIEIAAVAPAAWKRLRGECAGKIDSLVELLQGRLSGGVMELMTRKEGGLFPAPREIRMQCSCPDYATLCKHVAAVLYGVGARLDERPELLFTLRQVDHLDLVAGAASEPPPLEAPAPASGGALAGADLSAIFGIEIEAGPAPAPAPAAAPAPGTPRESKAPAKEPPTRKPRARKEPAEEAPARKKKPAKKPGAPRARAAQAPAIAAKDLAARGIPHAIMQRWLRAGVLVPTGQRGVYLGTPRTEPRIATFLRTRRG